MRKLPWPEILVTVLAIGAGVGVYLYAHRDQPQLEETKLLGTQVVAALEAHRSERGTYPSSLEELVPEYLPALPEPTWGLRRWTYRAYTSAHDVRVAPGSQYFSLAVPAEESGYPVLFYDLTTERWVLNN